MHSEKGFLRPEDFFASALEGLDEDTRSSFSELAADHYREQIGDPGEFPFTRGVYATMYRGRKPTMRQFAGHGLANDTNERFKTVLRLGGTGLSTAFDLPTLMGRDSDDPISEGQVGWDGAALDTLADMEDLFDGIPIEDITVSMTINGPAAIVLAMYFAMAQKRGIPLEKLGGTTQNDILKEYIAQKEWLFPVDKGVDLVVAAMSVGPPSRSNCGACHFFAGGGDNVKKGDMGSWAADPSEDADVHMGGEGMTCVSCHTAEDHQIAGGGLHNPVEEAPLACGDCHQGPVIHEDAPDLDEHTQHVACETCHIKTYSRQQPTKLEWWWETAGDADREPVLDAYGKPDYDKMKGDFVWGQEVEPVLAWSNGTFTRMLVGDVYTAEPVDLGSPMGDISDPAAKIAPFKVMRGNQPADTVNSVLAVPHLFGTASGPNPYWGAWDWDAAIAEGMAAAGLDYSGTYGFTETYLYMELHHEVSGGDAARQCMDCHNGGIDFIALGYSGDPMVVGGEHATE